MSGADPCLVFRQEEARLRDVVGLPHSHTINKLQGLDQNSGMHVSCTVLKNCEILHCEILLVLYIFIIIGFDLLSFQVN